MLSMRKRGKAQNYYIRGTVTLGEKRIEVPEFSSGTRDRDAAAHLMALKEQELREQLMFGQRAQVARATIADAFAAYLDKPNRPNSSDIVRVAIMNERIGNLSLADPHSAWTTFREGHLLRHAAAGQDRYRSLLQAAINYFHADRNLPPIKIKAIKFDNKRVRFLSHGQRDLLISCYVPHVQPIITFLAFQGARTQEALQVQWGIDGVDLDRGSIWLGRTKNGDPRSVPLHPTVEAVLRPLWESRGRPDRGHVFLNRLGKPYQDTRDAPIQGGNPLKRAHATACERAGIQDFTVHDWRHHWASHCVMAGIDLETLKRLGGWKSLRMVERYAAVCSAHMTEAIRKLK